MRKQIIYFSFFTLLVLTGCKKKEQEITLLPDDRDYTTGTYVSNEGSFLSNNASISWIDADGAVTNDLFHLVNGVELGDVLTALLIEDGLLYAVLNNSQKIEVIDLASFSRTEVITDASLDYPRSILSVDSEKAYITNGSLNGNVLVLDKSTNSIQSQISVGNGPEGMVKNSNHVFVANSGGWGTDNTISIIDLLSDEVVETVSVGDRPSSVVVDSEGDVWVLCSGETQYDDDWNVVGHTLPGLYEIDVDDFSIKSTVEIGEEGDHPRSMSISPDGLTLYFINNELYSISTNGGTSAAQMNPGPFGTVDCNQSGEIWVTQIPDYITPGMIFELDQAGNTLNEFECGIAPNSVIFQ
jgi:YVTN family beta-propeller protein